MNWKRVLKSWYFWSAMIFIVILSVIWETWNSVTVDMVDLPKFETGGISKVLADQNGVMIAGAILVGIVAAYLLRKILGKILIVGIILTIAFFAYREWDSVEKGLWDAKMFADKAITKSIEIDSLTGGQWEDIPNGRYRVTIRGDMYFYKCPGDKGAASGYPEGKTLSGGKDGKIIVWSGIARDNPQGNGGEFIVGPQDKVFWKFDTECPDQETVVQQSTASVSLSPVRLQ